MRTVIYMRVGYKEELDFNPKEIDKETGADAIYQDLIFGTEEERDRFDAMLKYLGQGDKVIIPSRYRLSRDVYQALKLEQEILKRGATIEYLSGEVENMGRTFGYMRISTVKDTQSFDRQEAQLKEQCDGIYQDRMSGAKRERPELNKMLNHLEAGDTVIILSIDRLSRSTKDLLEIVEIIKNKGAYLKSINDTWLDTTSDNPMSDFLLTIMGALAQMERQMIVGRVREGVKIAMTKGVEFGRPKANKNKVAHALELYDGGCHTSKEIADITGISRKTLYNKLREREQTTLN